MILSDKVNSGLIIQYLPMITENLIHLMSTNNSVRNLKFLIFLSLGNTHYLNNQK